MKRKLAVCLVLTLILSMIAGVAAQASIGSYSYYFTNTKTEDDCLVLGERTAATGKNWKMCIELGNLSSTNILGCKPRKGFGNSATALGPYQLYKKKHSSPVSRTYSTSVKKGTNVNVRAKKDSTSTSTADLWAEGYVTP